MLRNDLMTRLTDYDNDTVVVTVGGCLVDIALLTYEQGQIVLLLDPEELRKALTHTGPRPR